MFACKMNKSLLLEASFKNVYTIGHSHLNAYVRNITIEKYCNHRGYEKGKGKAKNTFHRFFTHKWSSLSPLHLKDTITNSLDIFLLCVNPNVFIDKDNQILVSL